MSWSTDFDKMPKTGRVIVQCKPARQREDFKDPSYIYDVDTIKNTLEYCLAWHPAPAPYAPPRPRQMTPYDVHGSTSLDAIQLDIDAVEKRTREIVAWEAKHGGK